MRARSWRPVSFALCTDHRLPGITQETLMMCFSSRNTDEKSSMARPQHFSQTILPIGEAGYIPRCHHLLSQIANIRWIIKKTTEFQKYIYFCFIDYAKAFDCVDHNKLWKMLQAMGLPDHLTCLLRNLYADQEATVRTGHGKTDWFQIGKGLCQGCILLPCLFNSYAEYIM